MKKRNKRHYGGFTLIELLVVVTIMVVIMAIVLPVLAQVRKAALAIQCESNMGQCGVFFTNFMQDYDGYLVPNYDSPPNKSQLKSAFGLDVNNYRWGTCINAAGYINEKNKAVLRCPSMQRYKSMDNFTRTYGSQRWRRFVRPNQLTWGINNTKTVGYTKLYSKNPADFFILADSIEHPSRSDRQQYYYLSRNSGGYNGYIHTRHGGAANILFLDGSVRNAKAQELRSKKYEINWGNNNYLKIWSTP